jgi:hypothetical protein
MVLLTVVPGDHGITPERGSAHRVRDGQPADLTRVSDYPVLAVCLTCGQPVRCERFYLAEWRHIEPEDGSD